MSNAQEYPTTGGPLIRANPTLANFIVPKFKPKSGYREMERITNELGKTVDYNGVDFIYSYEAEIIPLAGATEPQQLTELTFVKNTSTAAALYPGAVSGTGNINVVIISEVTTARDEAGKVLSYSFTCETTANTPSPNT